MKRIFGPIIENWFLIGLIFLAALAVPGIVLVILRLVGGDVEINDWLRTTLNLTYELRVEPWVAIILLLFPFILILLYFLKLKRKPIQVPSTFLWKKSIEDLHVNSLFQWLRNNILLLLQLLVTLFLIYSILGLRYHGSTETARHYILLIDNSASMSAKDASPSRLAWAKAEAMKEIDAAADTDVGMVIEFNSKATTLQTYTNDKEKLREAVRGIEQTNRPTRIEEALALAESLANPVRSTDDAAMQPADVPEDQKRTMVQLRGISTVVHLYSDGRFAKLTEAALANFGTRQAGKTDKILGNLNLRYHMAGTAPQDDKARGHANNVAVVGLNVLKQPAPAGKKNEGEHLMLAVVRVANFRNATFKGTVKLDVLVDGVLTHPLEQDIEVRKRTLTPATDEAEEKDEPGERDARFKLPPLDARRNIVLHAQLVKPGDDFPLDDQAWLAIGTTRKAKVLLVGNANPVLDAFFDQDATQKIANIERLKPADLGTDTYRKKARSGEVDLVLFDRCAPEDETDMPLANTFFIDRPPPPWERGKATIKNPLMMPSKQQQPLLRFLTTIWEVRTHEAFIFDVQKNLNAKAAEQLALPDGDPKKRVLPPVSRIIETSNQMPLLFTMPRGPHTDLIMTFGLMNDQGELVSEWPLQTSFPLFFRNVLYILGNVDDSVRAVSVSAGEPVVLRPEAGFNQIDVTTPEKQRVPQKRDPNRNEIIFSKTEQLGVYRYQVTDLDAAKGQPVRAFAVNLLDLNESNIEPRRTINIGNEEITTGEEKAQTREIWKWALLLAVGLLAAEWFVYQRRIAV
jgi:hypothetical protein